jgi:hypothetical protein
MPTGTRHTPQCALSTVLSVQTLEIRYDFSCFAAAIVINRPQMLLIIATLLLGAEYLFSARRSRQREITYREEWGRRLDALCRQEAPIQKATTAA